MRPLSRATFIIAVVGVLSCVPAAGHHFFAPEYERDARGTIAGEVISVAYANPHVSIEIAAVLTDGRIETWHANTVGIRSLPGRGWEAGTIKAGQRVTVEGFLGRDGSRRLWIQSIELPSGQQIFPVGRER